MANQTAPISPISIPAEDMQKEKYIRTYAMDLARVTEQNPDSKNKASKEDKKLFFSSLKTSLHSENKESAPQTDESLIIHDQPVEARELSDLEREAEMRDRRATAAQQEISAELSDLEGGAAEPISLPKINPEPSQPAKPSFIKIPTPPEPQAIPLPKKIEDTEDTQSARESILDRLRKNAETKTASTTERTLQPVLPQKVETSTEPPIQAEPVSVPPAPPISTIQEVDREAMLTRLRDKIEVQQKTIASGKDLSHIIQSETPSVPQPQSSPFHSYSSDFADRVDEQQASTFSVLAAENDKTSPSPVRQQSRIEWLPIIAGFILMIGAAAGVLYAYQFMRNNTPATTSNTPNLTSLVSVDQKVTLSATDPTSALIRETEQPFTEGEILATYPSPQPGNSSQGGDLLFNELGLQAPDILARNIDPASTIGVVRAGNETRPFFLLKVDSYQRTFSGMLQWENTMVQNLGSFYPAYASTASSTASVASQFTDDTVTSHPVRVLRDSQGNTIMLYGFTADKQILIIARNEAAFTLLLQRLSTGGN